MLRTIVLALVLCAGAGWAAITLQEVSDIFVPNAVDPEEYKYNSNSAVSGAVDKPRGHYYVGGNGQVSVYDVGDLQEPTRLFTQKLIAGTVGDLEVCGGYVAVAKDNTNSPEDGQVIIYRAYDDLLEVMETLHVISVGTNPRDLDFTADCTKIVVAVEGTLSNVDGSVYDPEGLVAVISWESEDLSQPYTLQIADFTKFNPMAQQYVKKGVRWVYRGEGSGVVNTFSQDLEPESVEIGYNEDKAYIVLQENNAIAVMDMENVTIDDIIPLGVKDFSVDGFDASDRDAGININPWPVKGMYLPSRVTKTTVDGVQYLVLANEGSERAFTQPDYPFSWRESKTGKEIFEEGLLSENAGSTVKAMIQDDQLLGRTRFSTLDGIDVNGTGIETLHVYGCRSYSFLFMSNLSLAYESGSSIETAISTANPTIFNSDPMQATLTPVESYDMRSPYMGPEPDAIATANINDRDVIFVGTGRPGQILVYSTPELGPLLPQLEGVFYVGGNGETWQELYNQGDTRSLGIEQLEVIEGRNPTLAVIGRTSGTVNFFRIRETGDSLWTKMVKSMRSMPSQVKAFGKSILPESSQEGGTVQPIAVAAICLSSLALVVGAALLAVTLKRQRRSSQKKPLVNDTAL